MYIDYQTTSKTFKMTKIPKKNFSHIQVWENFTYFVRYPINNLVNSFSNYLKWVNTRLAHVIIGWFWAHLILLRVFISSCPL